MDRNFFVVLFKTKVRTLLIFEHAFKVEARKIT
jgi:hypothetical protein